MTFSLAIRCARTGAFGVAGTTSSIAVGARCLFVEAGAGVVITQHRTDPRLGPKGLELLMEGHTASEVVASLVRSTPHEGWRELAVLDREGNSSVHQGRHQERFYARSSAPNVVAVGNILRNERVPEAMVATACFDENATLADRLIAGLRAGLDAGGEIFTLKSAGLKVADHPGFASVDLRVDLSDNPIEDLAQLWRAYEPQQALFVQRVLDPDSSGRATCSAEILEAE